MYSTSMGVNYEEAKETVKDCRVELVKRGGNVDLKLANEIKRLKLRRVGLDAIESSVYLKLRKALKGVRLKVQGKLVWELREVKDEFELNEDASLSDLLNKLAGIHGEAFRKEVYEPGLKDAKTGFVVTVNGVLMGQLRGVDTRLSEGDNVILMTLMSGG